MGAEFNFETLKAKTDVEAGAEVADIIHQAAYDFGHAGYTGSLAEANGIELCKDGPFANYDAAEEWLNEHCEKWGPAIICKTIDGGYCVGAWCSS